MSSRTRDERVEDQEEFERILKDNVADFESKVGRTITQNDLKVEYRNLAFLSRLEVLMKASPMPPALPYKGKKAKTPGRILNLMLSDLHYGSDITRAETGVRYGPIEEARRTAAVITTTADWKRQYRKETVLYVHLLGDIVEGKLHDVESAAPMAEQFERAVWNLRQSLRFLASEFQQVTIFTSPGNHGRRKDRHHGRAVNQKWDSYENMIYVALKLGLSEVPNITFNIPRSPYYRYKAFDQKGFMTHGDTVLNVGYPNKAISVESIRRQINEINAKEHCHLFGAGHVHVASNVRLPSGPVLVTNGCLVPSGEFGQSIGIMDTVCCQQIWESVPGVIYGHRMDILIDNTVDKSRSFDSVVRPWKRPRD